MAEQAAFSITLQPNIITLQLTVRTPTKEYFEELAKRVAVEVAFLMNEKFEREYTDTHLLLENEEWREWL